MYGTVELVSKEKWVKDGFIPGILHHKKRKSQLPIPVDTLLRSQLEHGCLQKHSHFTWWKQLQNTGLQTACLFSSYSYFCATTSSTFHFSELWLKNNPAECFRLANGRKYSNWKFFYSSRSPCFPNVLWLLCKILGSKSLYIIISLQTFMVRVPNIFR